MYANIISINVYQNTPHKDYNGQAIVKRSKLPQKLIIQKVIVNKRYNLGYAYIK